MIRHPAYILLIPLIEGCHVSFFLRLPFPKPPGSAISMRLSQTIFRYVNLLPVGLCTT